MSKHAGPGEQLWAVSALARLFRLDRGTVARRLAKVTPAKVNTKGKCYLLEEAAPALARPDEGNKAASARQEKLESEAALLKLKLGRESGELMARRDVLDHAFRLVRAMQLRLGVRMPREIAAQLYRAASEAQVFDVLHKEVGRAFRELKADHESFVTTEGGAGDE